MADVWRRYGPEDLDRFGQDLRPSHRRAMADLLACRTEALGGQLWQCEPWGQEPYVDHACRHRRGPQGHRHATEGWREARRQERLPVPYCQVVLTRPQERRALVRRQQKDLDDLLLRAAAPALITLAADPHDVGGLIGGLGVLHTWTRALVSHPQVHCLGPAGTPDLSRAGPGALQALPRPLPGSRAPGTS